MLVTADALYTDRGNAEYLQARGGHYLWVVKDLWVVKANQPRLHAAPAACRGRISPVVDEQQDRGHGRVETRRVTLSAVGAGVGFPHARLALQVHRRRRSIGSRSWTSETVYAVTSMNWRQALADLVADAIRGHWRIEALDWIRDVSLGEDVAQIRTGNGPAVMASLRNTAVSPQRLAGKSEYRRRLP